MKWKNMANKLVSTILVISVFCIFFGTMYGIWVDFITGIKITATSVILCIRFFILLDCIEEHGKQQELIDRSKPEYVKVEKLVNGNTVYRCPHCNYLLSKKDNTKMVYLAMEKYCPICGQKLDWESIYWKNI